MTLLRFIVALWHYFRAYRWICLLLLLGILVIELGYQTGIRYSLKLLVDSVIVKKQATELFFLLGAFAVGSIFFGIFVIFQDWHWSRVTAHIVRNLRLDLFSHLQSLCALEQSRLSVGDLGSRFTADIERIESGLTRHLPNAIWGLGTLGLALVVTAYVSWPLALVSTIGIVSVLQLPRLIEARTDAANDLVRRDEGRAAALFQQSVASQAVITAFGVQGRFANLLSERLQRVFTSGTRALFLSYLQYRLPAIAIIVAQVIALGLSSYLAFTDRITIGTLILCQVLFSDMEAALFMITANTPGLLNGLSGWRRIAEIHQRGPSVRDPQVPVPIGPLCNGISLREVSFSYEDAAPILRNVSLTLAPKGFTALVGPSGSGKSTIMKLILRLMDPSHGAVCFNEVDIRRLRQADLRVRFGVVFQDPFVLDLSLSDNIRIGKPSATDAEVEDAARAAELHDFIRSLPNAYATLAGEGGGWLSGGQRQRLALARALVRQPDVLLLDEITSALDANTEAEITTTLRRLSQQCAVVAVTHSLAMACQADQIAFLQAGRLIEQGSHSELLARGASYAQLWRAARGTEAPS